MPLYRALLVLIIIDAALLAWTAAVGATLGEAASPREAMLDHFKLGLLSSSLTCFIHVLCLFYLIGTGKDVRVAVEEHEEESTRLQFLTEQRDDLVQARNDLREAIREINLTATQLFTDTFQAIRENFRATFLHLFEGGECDLWLADPDDPEAEPEPGAVFGPLRSERFPDYHRLDLRASRGWDQPVTSRPCR